MITSVTFTEDLWRDIALQTEQRRDFFNPHAIDVDETWTFVDEHGHCLATGGLQSAADGLAVAWAFVGADAGPHMPALVARAREALQEGLERWPIIRAGARIDFPAAHRLLRMLGFRPTGLTVTFEARVYSVFELRARGHLT